MMAGKPAPQPISKSKPDHAGVKPGPRGSLHELTGGRPQRVVAATKQNNDTGTGTGISPH